MLTTARKRKFTGIGLIVIGALFLMVSNNVLLGWANVWPLFPILGGILFLRVYARNKTPEMLFGAIASLFMGVFLLFFSLGIFPWSRMESFWPVIPAIAGIGLLAISTTHRQGTPALIMGVVVILFAFLGFLREGGIINERVVSPFFRLWPLVLVAAGITMLRTRPKGDDTAMEAVRQVVNEGSDSSMSGSEQKE
jgi:hypothetical protein